MICLESDDKSLTSSNRGYGVMKLSRYEQETIVNYNAGEQQGRTRYLRSIPFPNYTSVIVR